MPYADASRNEKPRLGPIQKVPPIPATWLSLVQFNMKIDPITSARKIRFFASIYFEGFVTICKMRIFKYFIVGLVKKDSFDGTLRIVVNGVAL